MRSLLAGRALVGTFVKLPRPEVVDVLAQAGFDFAVLDLEHGQVGEVEARQALLAGRACGLPLVVRMATVDTGLANRLLEAGAAGIQLAHVRSAADAAALTAALWYPPAGGRSISTTQPAARYGAVPVREYLDEHRTRPLRVGQLETASYGDDLTKIMAGLDVAFIGIVDLSVDAGFSAPVVDQVVEQIGEAARETGTTLGIFASSAAAGERAIKAGYGYVVVGSDLSLLADSARAMTGGLRVP